MSSPHRTSRGPRRNGRELYIIVEFFKALKRAIGSRQFAVGPSAHPTWQPNFFKRARSCPTTTPKPRDVANAFGSIEHHAICTSLHQKVPQVLPHLSCALQTLGP